MSLDRILTDRYQLAHDSVQHQLLCKHLQGLDREERALLEQGRIPEAGWSEHQIQSFLLTLAKADSPYNARCGLGEREGRIACPMVAARHYHLVHGIGRSGDLGEWQPKAAGSSLIYRLVSRLLLDFAKRMMAWTQVTGAVVLPVATGMALFFCLKAFALPNRRQVLWFRADQKSAIKAVSLAGFELVVIEGILTEEGCIESNIPLFQELIRGAQVAAVMSTSSCFAPRGCDELALISKVCAQHGIPHIVNNAYGLQSPLMRQEIQKGLRTGRVDAIVQSGDKNFMIPVSCAIVYTTSSSAISKVTAVYPGRASIAGITDLFCTIMFLGATGWYKLDRERIDNFQYLKMKLSERGIRFIECSKNDISLAIVPQDDDSKKKLLHAFAKGISGIRTVPVNKTLVVSGTEFKGWQAHHQAYPLSYVNVAVAMGCSKQEIDLFLQDYY